MNFSSLHLHEKILKAVTEAGYTTPTDIQKEAIPTILEGADLRASAQTGTGKTAAFLLPALHRLVTIRSKGRKGARVLILVPTRELAQQISEQADKYSKYLYGIRTVCIVGGLPYPAQIQRISRPHDILIATPGRLIDLLDQGKVDFSRLEMLILDEADRMLDMGFIEPVEKIVQALPEARQTLLFSATLQGKIFELSERIMKDPKEILISQEQKKHENIDQKLHYVDDLSHKNRLLEHILKEQSMTSAIVFTSTKRHADQLVDELLDKGYTAAALHGDMNQRQRTRTIQRMKSGNLKILVATDVVARGIDVQSITHIINFDLPRNVEDYVHRIGRTGRAGAQGTALSFAAQRDQQLVKKIEEFTGHPIEIVEVAGLEPRKRRSRPTPPTGNRPFSSARPSNRWVRGKPRQPRVARRESFHGS